MKTLKLTLLATLLALLSTLTPQLSAAPLGTAFTYQGRLNDTGAPAQGIYDLRFTIYDAPTDGSALGGVLTNTATPVANGLFTVALDFGPGVFTGDARWLQIEVRTNGSPEDFLRAPCKASGLSSRRFVVLAWPQDFPCRRAAFLTDYSLLL